MVQIPPCYRWNCVSWGQLPLSFRFTCGFLVGIVSILEARHQLCFEYPLCCSSGISTSTGALWAQSGRRLKFCWPRRAKKRFRAGHGQNFSQICMGTQPHGRNEREEGAEDAVVSCRLEPARFQHNCRSRPSLAAPNRFCRAERSLLEECTMSVSDPRLYQTLVCLQETAEAGPKVVAALRSHGFPSAESALTGRSVRVHAVGMVLYRGDGHNDFRVSEVYFHASLGGELFACLSHWPLKRETSQWKKVIVICPSEGCLLYSPRLYQTHSRMHQADL